MGVVQSLLRSSKNPGVNADNIAKAGGYLLLALYGASAFNTLNNFIVVFKWQVSHPLVLLLVNIHIGHRPTAKFRNGWRTILNQQNGDGFK